MRTQREVRLAFWEFWADACGVSVEMIRTESQASNGKPNTDTRCAFVEFVDGLQKGGVISEALAYRVTL